MKESSRSDPKRKESYSDSKDERLFRGMRVTCCSIASYTRLTPVVQQRLETRVAAQKECNLSEDNVTAVSS